MKVIPYTVKDITFSLTIFGGNNRNHAVITEVALFFFFLAITTWHNELWFNWGVPAGGFLDACFCSLFSCLKVAACAIFVTLSF